MLSDAPLPAWLRAGAGYFVLWALRSLTEALTRSDRFGFPQGREAFRVLKPGGRLAISDVVTVTAMPPELAQSVEALTGCIAGSASIEQLRSLLAEAGFDAVKIEPRAESRTVIAQCMPGAEDYVVSATIEALKPGGAACCGPSCCS